MNQQEPIDITYTPLESLSEIKSKYGKGYIKAQGRNKLLWVVEI